MANRTDGGGISRRSLLRTAGLGAGAVAVGRALPGQAAVAGTGAASSAVSGGAGALTEPLMLARVWADRKSIQKPAGFDDTHVVYPDGSVQYLLWPGDLAKLRASGLRHEIHVADLVAHDRRLAAEAKARGAAVGLARQPGETAGDYRHLADFETDMKALAAKYPNMARIFALPFKTLEKRTVWATEICTDVNRRGGRPVFYMDGCHHAREWPAAEVPIMWAHDLLNNYTKDARIKAIVDNVRTILVPVVNADGFQYSRESPRTTASPPMPYSAQGPPASWVVARVSTFARTGGRWSPPTSVTAPRILRSRSPRGTTPS